MALEKKLATAQSSTVSYDAIANNVQLLTHYTGLPSAAIFSLLLDYYQRFPLTYWDGWKALALCPAYQLRMAFMKLRCNFTDIDLAYRLKVSALAVRNVKQTRVTVLHKVLYTVHCTLYTVHCTLYTVHYTLYTGRMERRGMPSAAKNRGSLPAAFTNFPSCCIILDCTEVQVAMPTAMDAPRATFSHYKQRNTFKGLIGVAPNGTITFCSKLYPVNTSDKGGSLP